MLHGCGATLVEVGTSHLTAYFTPVVTERDPEDDLLKGYSRLLGCDCRIDPTGPLDAAMLVRYEEREGAPVIELEREPLWRDIKHAGSDASSVLFEPWDGLSVPDRNLCLVDGDDVGNRFRAARGDDRSFTERFDMLHHANMVLRLCFRPRHWRSMSADR